MPITLRIPDPALFTQAKPLAMSGTGWLGDSSPGEAAPFSVLGFTYGDDAIPTGSIQWSYPILVAGYNSFMVVILVDIASVELFVAVCDPTTNAQLVTFSVDTAPPLVATTMLFGAFAPVVSEDFAGFDWNVIQIGLTGVGIDATLLRIDFFAGTR